MLSVSFLLSPLLFLGLGPPVAPPLCWVWVRPLADPLLAGWGRPGVSGPLAPSAGVALLATTAVGASLPFPPGVLGVGVDTRIIEAFHRVPWPLPWPWWLKVLPFSAHSKCLNKKPIPPSLVSRPQVSLSEEHRAPSLEHRLSPGQRHGHWCCFGSLGKARTKLARTVPMQLAG